MSRPITAILSVYNHRKYVAASIRSLLDQTSPVDRIVCYDDGSTDGSREVIFKMLGSDPRVRFASDLETNKGLMPRLIAAWDMVADGYVIHLSGDDIWHPRAVEIHRAALERSNAEWSIAAVQVTDEALNPLVVYDPFEILARHGGDVYRALLFGEPLFIHGWCISADLYRRVGGYANLLPEDYPFGLKIAKVARPVITGLITSYYRQTPGSITNSRRDFDVAYNGAWMTLRESGWAPRMALKASSGRFGDAFFYAVRRRAFVRACICAGLSFACWPMPRYQLARLRKNGQRAARRLSAMFGSARAITRDTPAGD